MIFSKEEMSSGLFGDQGSKIPNSTGDIPNRTSSNHSSAPFSSNVICSNTLLLGKVFSGKFWILPWCQLIKTTYNPKDVRIGHNNATINNTFVKGSPCPHASFAMDVINCNK